MPRRKPAIVESAAPRGGVVPAWLLDGPVGDEPLSAWLTYSRRREQWRREAGLTMAELHRLVPGRGPGTRYLIRAGNTQPLPSGAAGGTESGNSLSNAPLSR